MIKGLAIRTVLATVLVSAALAWAGTPSTQAAGPEPMTAPAGIDAAHPTVSGTLFAKPGGENSTSPCTDRATPTTESQTNRGLVICTEEGTLVLLQLHRGTDIAARYWGDIRVGQLRVGDHINAWGTLKDNGQLLNPTKAVQDTDEQRAYTDSQDYISARSGRELTLMVLKSDSGGPVQGIVHAVPGGTPNVTRCDGSTGSWADLKPGKTINISDSLFNRRTDTYIETVNVHIVC